MSSSFSCLCLHISTDMAQSERMCQVDCRHLAVRKVWLDSPTDSSIFCARLRCEASARARQRRSQVEEAVETESRPAISFLRTFFFGFQLTSPGRGLVGLAASVVELHQPLDAGGQEGL